MALINPPAWLQAGSYDARTDRTVVSSFLTSEGLTSQSAMQVTQDSPLGMSVSVGAGSAFIIHNDDLSYGAYAVRNDGATSVPVTAAHPTLSRVDLIVVRVYDAQYAGAVNSVTFEAIAGTPAGSPSAPALPDSAVELARVTVPPAASSIVNSNIDMTKRVYASLQPRLASVMENSGSLPNQTTPRTGQQYYIPGTGTYIWNGSTWILVWSETRVPVQRSYGAGTVTWTKPANLVAVWVRCWGAGGAGGGRMAGVANQITIGGGGGSGAYVEGWIPASSLPATVTITIGSGGNAVSGAAGGSGGDSKFGTFLTGGGGGGGAIDQQVNTASFAVNGGSGGLATVSGVPGGIGLNGQTGGQAFSTTPAPLISPAVGGSAPLGGSGGLFNGVNRTGNAFAGAVPGGGGGGQSGSSTAQGAVGGGAGGDGRVILVEFY